MNQEKVMRKTKMISEVTPIVQKNQNILQYLILGFEVVVLKEWKCVLVGHHDNVGKAIEDWEKAGSGVFIHIQLLKCVQDLRLITICCLKKANRAKQI